MKPMLRILVILLFSFSSLSILADNRRLLEVGISMSIPPWVIKESDSGIELDIMNAALSASPYQVKPVYLPFARAYKQFEAGSLDVVMNAAKGVTKNGFLSDPVVTFHNYAISLAKKGFPKSIDMNFLADHSVVAFQKARNLLGEEFKNTVSTNKHYQEVAKQALQINLLFIREIDFIIMDKSIFGYFWNNALNRNNLNKNAKSMLNRKVVFHDLFPPSHYPYIFKDKEARDTFNKGLQRIKDNGVYQDILNKYDHLKNLYRPEHLN